MTEPYHLDSTQIKLILDSLDFYEHDLRYQLEQTFYGKNNSQEIKELEDILFRIVKIENIFVNNV